MNRNTTILAVVAGLLMVIYLFMLFSAGDRNSQTVAFPANPEELIIRHGGEEFILRHTEEGWTVAPTTASSGKPADQQTVGELLAPIRGDQRLLVASTDGEGSYGLSPESRVTLVIGNPESSGSVTLQLGAATGGGRQVYATIDGESSVYLLDRRVKEIAGNGSAAIRDKVIRRLEEGKIGSINLEIVAGPSVSITRRPEADEPAPGSLELQGDVARIARTWQARGADLEPYQLENFFQEIRTLRANRFDEEAESVSEEPTARLTVTLIDGRELPMELRPISGAGYRLRGEGLPDDAVILPWRARRLTLGLLQEE